jgi:hypothetical protein
MHEIKTNIIIENIETKQIKKKRNSNKNKRKGNKNKENGRKEGENEVKQIE